MGEADGDAAVFDARFPKVAGSRGQRIAADTDREIDFQPSDCGGQICMLATLFAGLG